MKVGTLIIPERFQRLLPVFRLSGPTAAGISGGRTSALMHALTLAANQDQLHLYTPCFANTGKEHEAALRFLHNIEDATKSAINWLEFTAPERLGVEPKHSRYKVVDFETASRTGQPFTDYLETSLAYRREAKDIGPAALGAMRRLCTSYLKIRTMHKFVQATWGREAYDHFVGLRADEPERVARLVGAYAVVTMRTPLADAGITKAMVFDFWKQQLFDLEAPEHLGNCTLCFLKDEADQGTVAYEMPGEAAWWVKAQDRHGNWRAGKASTRTIAAEARIRVEVIRTAVAGGASPSCPPDFEAEPTWLASARSAAGSARSDWTDREWAIYRWKLIVKQEERRLKTPPGSFSCACESAQLSGVGEDE